MAIQLCEHGNYILTGREGDLDTTPEGISHRSRQIRSQNGAQTFDEHIYDAN
jgi:hypothetical protein